MTLNVALIAFVFSCSESECKMTAFGFCLECECRKRSKVNWRRTTGPLDRQWDIKKIYTQEPYTAFSTYLLKSNEKSWKPDCECCHFCAQQSVVSDVVDKAAMWCRSINASQAKLSLFLIGKEWANMTVPWAKIWSKESTLYEQWQNIQVKLAGEIICIFSRFSG